MEGLAGVLNKKLPLKETQIHEKMRTTNRVSFARSHSCFTVFSSSLPLTNYRSKAKIRRVATKPFQLISSTSGLTFEASRHPSIIYEEHHRSLNLTCLPRNIPGFLAASTFSTAFHQGQQPNAWFMMRNRSFSNSNSELFCSD